MTKPTLKSLRSRATKKSKDPPSVLTTRKARPAKASAAAKPDALVGKSPLGFSATEFHAQLMAWYRLHARKLPWRGVKDPYATWLSEIMLQQTRVATVIDRYTAFLQRFPTLRALAEAEEADVLALWSGLGYYRRARMLHRGAQFVLREWRGRLPRTVAELRTLPGVGEYTAAAIASIAFGQQAAVLDGNVERVLLRLLGREEEKSTRGRALLVAAAEALLPPAEGKTTKNLSGDHNQAMMELGATVCLPRAPLCLQCPVAGFCRTRGEHPTRPRAPQQSRIVAHLLALRKRGVSTEVLLEQRGDAESLMPGMMELPPLPLEAIAGREPVLRLRHAITNTNYYVQIFAESAPGVRPEPLNDPEPLGQGESPALSSDWEEELFKDELPAPLEATLLTLLPATQKREWVPVSRLPQMPLTGLARKSLQRLGVMAVPQVQIG